MFGSEILFPIPLKKAIHLFIAGYILVSVLLPSCSDVKNSAEYRKVLMDRDSALEILENQEKAMAAFASEFDLIESNLSSIDTNKAKVLNLSTGGKEHQKDRIHALIANIYIDLDENQASLKKLEDQVRKIGKSEVLQSAVRTLRNTLEAKELEIVNLQKELEFLQIEVKNLKDAMAYKEKQLAEKDTLLAKKEAEIEKQEKIIGDKENELSKVYFIRGSTKELEAAGIIKKEGGLLGIGSAKVLGEKLCQDKIKILNLKNDKMLLLGNIKKKKVITPHPSDSYFFLARDGQYFIKISYPEKFWSLSRYLVVAVD